MASALRAMGLPIAPVVTMETNNREGARKALNVIRHANKAKGQLKDLNLSLQPIRRLTYSRLPGARKKGPKDQRSTMMQTYYKGFFLTAILLHYIIITSFWNINFINISWKVMYFSLV